MNISSPVKQKDDLFEVVLNTVSDGVTVIDNELKIKFQNKVITQLFGSSMIGKQCYKVSGAI
jgi:nitrogen fixation/metabolism regulation signal transduction histidine kinase